MLLTYFISANYDKLSLQGRVSLCNRLADIEGKINIDLFLLVSNFKEPAFLWFVFFMLFFHGILLKFYAKYL